MNGWLGNLSYKAMVSGLSPPFDTFYLCFIPFGCQFFLMVAYCTNGTFNDSVLNMMAVLLEYLNLLVKT